jgi:hypothetical protein
MLVTEYVLRYCWFQERAGLPIGSDCVMRTKSSHINTHCHTPAFARKHTQG